MSVVVWLSLLGACLVLSLTPGAGAVNTMSTSLRFGWWRSIWTILGQQLALLVQILIVATGLGVVVASSPVLFDVIRYAGAAYLLFLGLRMILARPAVGQDAQPASRWGGGRAGSALGLLQRGFWVNMSNPKALVFILAFIPQFVRPDAPQLPQYLLISATMILCDILVMWGGFAVLARSFTRLNGTVRGQRVINRIFGSLFILMAVLLALGSR